MSRVRVGVIGCGGISTAAHIPILMQMRSVEITAIADTEERARRMARRLGPSASQHATIEDLLQAGNIDAVVIALPTALHASAATLALTSGVHVYLEKPVATALADTAPLLEAWRKSGRIGAIGHNYRFNALYQRMRESIGSGSIGNPLEIRTEFAVPSPPPGSWRDSNASGGGVLLDLATHHIDLIRFITGDEVQSVSAVIESRRSESDFATIEMTLGSQTTASITCSYADHFSDTVAVRGERGTVRVDRARSWDVEFIPSGREMPGLHKRLPSLNQLRHVVRKLRSPFHEPSFETALTAFVGAIRSGSQFTPDLDDGIAALRVAEAARASAQSGTPIAIDSQDSYSRKSPGKQ